MPEAAKLTLGPLYYHWPAEKRRDFYFRIADEAPIDDVYIGEVVCSKREKFYADGIAPIIERLKKAGKNVILSSLAMLTLPREMEQLKAMTNGDPLIEANDVAAIQALSGRPFVIGPMITIINEGSLSYLVGQGAKRIVFASEMNGDAIKHMASHFPDLEKEVQLFGRQPLAISMRCYSARAAGRDKDHCRMACSEYADGLPVSSIDGEGLLTTNGTQTLTRGYLVLVEEARELLQAGITRFRLSPQDCDMLSVAKLYRDWLDEKIEAPFLRENLRACLPDTPFINGYYHGREGRACVSC